jgi:hypothetical protein
MIRSSSVLLTILSVTNALPCVRAVEPSKENREKKPSLAKPFRFPEAKHGKGELKYINGLPVVTLAGTPEEIGEQMRVLTRAAGPYLLTYPMSYLKTKEPSSSRPSWLTLIQLG